jgi:uncharacterized damage-inducible protein DinB
MKEEVMHPLEGMAGQAAWATKNLSYNLGFIPEDKLAWKPAPTAKSAYEIAAEVAGVAHGMSAVIDGQAWPQSMPSYSSLKEAQDGVEQAGEAYAAKLRSIDPARLGETVELPFGSFPFARAVSFPVVDAIHHHGQIAYIQSLLGDTESHFYEMDNPQQ